LGEYPLQDIGIETGNLGCITASDGICSLGNLPSGTYNLFIENYPPNFRYIGSLTENRPISRGVVVYLGQGDTTVPIGLCVGPYGGLFDKGVPYDIWTAFGEGSPFGIHGAYDYRVPIGTKVYAPVPGVITIAGTYPEGEATCPGVRIVQIKTVYDSTTQLVQLGHLSRIVVEVGQHVNAWDLIGESGDSGACSTGRPHLELLVFDMDRQDEIDPYALNLWASGSGPSYR